MWPQHISTSALVPCRHVHSPAFASAAGDGHTEEVNGASDRSLGSLGSWAEESSTAANWSGEKWWSQPRKLGIQWEYNENTMESIADLLMV